MIFLHHGSDNRPDSPPYEGKGKKRADYLVNKMVQEGGAGLIKFLLRAAVSSAPVTTSNNVSELSLYSRSVLSETLLSTVVD
jgi:hypothetical protein